MAEEYIQVQNDMGILLQRRWVGRFLCEGWEQALCSLGWPHEAFGKDSFFPQATKELLHRTAQLCDCCDLWLTLLLNHSYQSIVFLLLCLCSGNNPTSLFALTFYIVSHLINSSLDFYQLLGSLVNRIFAWWHNLTTATRMHFAAIFVMQICVTHERNLLHKRETTEYNSWPQSILVL